MNVIDDCLNIPIIVRFSLRVGIGMAGTVSELYAWYCNLCDIVYREPIKRNKVFVCQTKIFLDLGIITSCYEDNDVGLKYFYFLGNDTRQEMSFNIMSTIIYWLTINGR